jgi:futalosine hydrolase
MPYKILYVTATKPEGDTIDKAFNMVSVQHVSGKFEIYRLVTGVGSISTAWSLNEWIAINGKPDLAINGGIAGSYRDEFSLGDVVTPLTDCFADSGIENGDEFLTLAEAGLANQDVFPFRGGRIYTDEIIYDRIKGMLKPVSAITVNMATGSEATREKLVKKFNPDIETMEGATFFYICSREYIPFLALRAISNKVEKRDRNKWNIKLALNNLSEKLVDVFLTL